MPYAGIAPGGAGTFFLSKKESTQRKVEPTAPDPSLRYGQPASTKPRGALWNSLRADGAPLEQPQRVRMEAVASLDATATARLASCRRGQRAAGIVRMTTCGA
ncbi:hypothetical protein SDC9_161857 [bioreactor metagenome]|uniref:Uncharacterized protein n=1 Tax=bioreactor metagenome TaxID=1076179 RepID=A0A645FKP6_9ZZZZ